MGSSLLDDRQGATRLPAFVTQTYPMPDVEAIPNSWRDVHLARQAEVFRTYPDDMSALAVRDVPATLAGSPTPGSDGGLATDDARRVAEETVGRKPEGALRDHPRPEAERPQQTVAPAKPQPAEPGTDGYAPQLFDTDSAVGRGERDTREYDPALFPAGGRSDRRGGQRPKDERPARWQEVGGVRIERTEQPQQQLPLVADSPVLGYACRPTRRGLPHPDAAPASDAAQQAVRAAATLESISSLSDWRLAGEQAIEKAKAAAQRAREQALAEAQAAGRSSEEATRLADRRGRRAAQAALEPYGDAVWRTPVKGLILSDADAHTLEVLARLHLAAPSLLAQLLEEPLSARGIRDRLGRLHDAGLVARADAGLVGRRGRPPALYAVAPRGLEYLRLRRRQIAPEQDAPRYLDKDRRLPTPGRGSEVPHELAIQVTLVALRQYGAQLHWHTTRMPGGRWDVGMVHEDQRDRTLRLADLLPAPGYTVHGEQLDAPATLEPDLSVQLQGPVRGERAVIDLLVEIDRTGRGAYNAAKFAAYDHFLGGWCLRTRRFGRERCTRPVVVFVARRSDAIPPLLHAADRAMTLGFGAPGHYERAAFDYPGRAHTAFTCMEWLLAGEALALRLPALPPAVRGSETDLKPERAALLPEEWWPARGR